MKWVMLFCGVCCANWMWILITFEKHLSSVNAFFGCLKVQRLSCSPELPRAYTKKSPVAVAKWALFIEDLLFCIHLWYLRHVSHSGHINLERGESICICNVTWKTIALAMWIHPALIWNIFPALNSQTPRISVRFQEIIILMPSWLS